MRIAFVMCVCFWRLGWLGVLHLLGATIEVLPFFRICYLCVGVGAGVGVSRGEGVAHQTQMRIMCNDYSEEGSY